MNSVLLGGANRANEESGAVETNLNSSLLEAEGGSSYRPTRTDTRVKEIELPKPSSKAIKTCICLNLAALIPAIVVLVVWLMTDENNPYPTSRTFQVFLDTESQYTEWDVCSMSFYSDTECTVAIAPQGTGHNSANIPVPTSMFDGRNSSCSTRVRLFNTTSPKDEDYWIGFTFDHRTTVKCVQMEAPEDINGCKSSGRCIFSPPCSDSDCSSICCAWDIAEFYPQHSTLKYRSGGKWEEFDSTNSYGSTTPFNATAPTTNNLWIILLCVWVVFAFLVVIFLISTPCALSSFKWQDKQIRILEDGARKASLPAWKCDEYQWDKFVVAEFGPKGRQRNENMWWMYLLAAVVAGPALMLVVKLRLAAQSDEYGSHPDMSWKQASEIFIPVGFGVTVLVGILVNIGIWVRFRKLRHKPQIAVLGTDSLHFLRFYGVAKSFSGDMAVGKRAWLFEKSVLIRFPDEGTLLVITGKRLTKISVTGPQYKNQTIRIPVPDSMVEDVRNALRASSIYKFNSTVAP